MLQPAEGTTGNCTTNSAQNQQHNQPLLVADASNILNDYALLGARIDIYPDVMTDAYPASIQLASTTNCGAALAVLVYYKSSHCLTRKEEMYYDKKNQAKL